MNKVLLVTMLLTGCQSMVVSPHGGTFCASGNPELDALAQDAIRYWREAGLTELADVGTSVECVPLKATLHDDGTVVGLTTLEPSTLPEIDLDPSYVFNKGIDYSVRVCAVAHEFGHALGFNHISDPSVMQPVGHRLDLNTPLAADVELAKQLL